MTLVVAEKKTGNKKYVFISLAVGMYALTLFGIGGGGWRAKSPPPHQFSLCNFYKQSS